MDFDEDDDNEINWILMTMMMTKSKVSNAPSPLTWHGLCQQLHNLEIASLSYWFQIPSIFYLRLRIGFKFHQYFIWAFVLISDSINILSEVSYWFQILSITYLSFSEFQIPSFILCWISIWGLYWFQIMSIFILDFLFWF